MAAGIRAEPLAATLQDRFTLPVVPSTLLVLLFLGHSIPRAHIVVVELREVPICAYGKSSVSSDRGLYGRGYYPYGYYYPYLWDYGYDGLDDSADYQDGNQTQDVYANTQPQVPYREDSGLQRDVQTLNGKIDRLQADVEARNRPKSEEPETALVFQDRHVEEVRNYAISGGTLWVLNDQAAKKIPLAKLDLPATVKMNDDRGVDFEIPK